MRIAVDTHTHSVASSHAYSTVTELAQAAFERGLAGFVLTDHGPSMPGESHPWHFGNLRVIPSTLRGVRFFKGIEANILAGGELDLGGELARLDFILAGFHDVSFAPRSRAENTATLVAALANPWTAAISHPGNPAFPIDFETVVEAARVHGKALEINNSSFVVRHGCYDNCLAIARLCAQTGTRMVVGSDAHFHGDVGNFTTALELLDTVGASEALVINATLERFEAFVAERKAAWPARA
ncbi:MAG: phosphatase [Spirochaetales bacterium]